MSASCQALRVILVLIKTPAPKSIQPAGHADVAASSRLPSGSAVIEARPWHSGDTGSETGAGGEVGLVGLAPQSHHSTEFKQASQGFTEVGRIVPSSQVRKPRHIQLHPLPKFLCLTMRTAEIQDQLCLTPLPTLQISSLQTQKGFS